MYGVSELLCMLAEAVSIVGGVLLCVGIGFFLGEKVRDFFNDNK